MLDKRTAAREALAAHDALRQFEETEPERDSEGMPFDAEAWMAWHDQYRVFFRRWTTAMDLLENAPQTPGMSRHPFSFRPICEEIISATSPAAPEADE